MLRPSIIAAIFHAKRRAAFTLVEMLVVMGIIVLLLAATLPALRGLNQSESRRGAVGNVMSVLDRARMMAISDGLCTYVVFACPANATQISPNLLGHAYAIYEDGDNISFIPVQKTPWLPLPRAMAFKVSPGDGSYTSVINRPSPPTFRLVSGASPGGPGTYADVALPCWKFDATGEVVDPPIGVSTNYFRLLMFPGFINPTGIEVPTQNTGGSATALTLQLEEIDVNPVTGRAKYIIDPTHNLQSSTPSSTAAP